MEKEINREVVQGFHDPDLKEAFELFDEDKDGEITIDELQKIMNLHGFYPTNEELQTMIENVDSNKNGTIDYDEFLMMMNTMREDAENFDDEDEITHAFKVFDKDGDGLITAEEIRQTMIGLGENVSEAEVKAMVGEADINGDGFIDFSEFSNLMKNSFGMMQNTNSMCKEV